MSQSIVNCDWGTTRFRLRAINAEPLRVEAEFRSLEGVGTLAELPASFDPIVTGTYWLPALRR